MAMPSRFLYNYHRSIENTLDRLRRCGKNGRYFGGVLCTCNTKFTANICLHFGILTPAGLPKPLEADNNTRLSGSD